MEPGDPDPFRPLISGMTLGIGIGVLLVYASVIAKGVGLLCCS